MNIVSKGVELVGGWRKLHDEQLYNLYCSLNIRVVKLRLKWVGNAARRGRCKQNFSQFT
jgi:hypothetical protein